MFMESSSIASPQCSLDFSFAFNDVNFSDRILRIEIMADPPDSRPDRLSHDNCTGREAAQDIEASPSMDHSVVRERIIHISSPILAAHSPFFYNLFSNGMRESKQQEVTLSVQASEEASLMDLLNFMYSNTLTRTTACALLEVLMIADKFQSASCLRHCSQLLLQLPMDCESALLYLDLPPTVLMSGSVQPLKDAAGKFLAAQFKDIDRFQEEVLNLPLDGIEAVLSSDDLQVATECKVYNLMLKWARKHYPNLEERREIIKTRLLRLIRFPLMISSILRQVLTCSDIDPELASKIVLDALFLKAKASGRHRCGVNFSTCHDFVERAYKYRPIHVVEFELPHPQIIVYFDLKRDECVRLFPAGQVPTLPFHFGGQRLILTGQCIIPGQENVVHCFGLVMFIHGPNSATSTVVCEFASRTKPSEEFVTWWKGTYTCNGEMMSVGCRNLFGVPWTTFIADGSSFFINDILHLRAELTIKN